MELVEAAAKKLGWRMSRTEYEGRSALHGVFAEAVAGSSELFVIPAPGGATVDLIVRPKLSDEELKATPQAALPVFVSAAAASVPDGGELIVRDFHGHQRIEMHFKGLLAVEESALAELIQERGTQYNPFHVPIMCVTTRSVPGATAAKMLESAAAMATPEAARQSAFSSIKGCLRSLELAFEELPESAGARLGMRSESGGALMLLVLAGSPCQVAEEAYTAGVQVRVMYRDSAPPEHRERAALFVSLAVRSLDAGIPVNLHQHAPHLLRGTSSQLWLYM